jgi:hypothetical protein
VRAKSCERYVVGPSIGQWGRTMAGGRPRTFSTLTCSSCKAFYQVVKVEAGPETADSEIMCRVCGSPLSGREGKFVLKYFFLREATRRQRHRRAKAD